MADVTRWSTFCDHCSTASRMKAETFEGVGSHSGSCPLCLRVAIFVCG